MHYFKITLLCCVIMLLLLGFYQMLNQCQGMIIWLQFSKFGTQEYTKNTEKNYLQAHKYLGNSYENLNHNIEPLVQSQAGNRLKNKTNSHTIKNKNIDNIGTPDKIGTSACSIPNPSARFDCHPEVNSTRIKCEARGCCWLDTNYRHKPSVDIAAPYGLAPVDVPYCFYPSDYNDYIVTKKVDTHLGFKIWLSSTMSSYYPGTVEKLSVDISFETAKRLHVKITDAESARFEVPLDVPEVKEPANMTAYNVTASAVGSRFSLTVTRTSSGQPVFSTLQNAPLIFTDQFLQLTSLLTSPYLSGLGEQREGIMLDVNWTRRTLWNLDHGPQENSNLYGSHPFYVAMETGGKANGFFLLNSNAMDVILQPLPAVTWRTIGGILDFYLFLGDSPADVISQYTEVIGRTFLPPYWSLGFHVCRFGYKNVSDTLKVTDRIQKAGIPQDVQWSDIDYAVGWRDFTIDFDRFGNISAMSEELHARGLKYVIITDPGISCTQPAGTYRPYDLGRDMDIFVKNISGQPFIGQVWPGPTVWPDFSNPATEQYWSSLIGEFHQEVPFDGLWIDMNEVSNFGDGDLFTQTCPDTRYDFPPYLPDVNGGRLFSSTMCCSCRQNLSLAYDLHNMYGSMETQVTNRALRSAIQGQRPFIISRSTFPGQGHYGGHWTGDNAHTWHGLYRSISAILHMNMFGIPMTGADICGFHLNATYELCLRFYQLGAFYPFSRTHNVDYTVDQDPGAFDDFFASSVRDVYLIRYSLLPLLYTLFYKSYSTGSTVARAMFIEFPQDVGSYGVDTQFLWGSELLIAPVLTEMATKVDVYLPPDTLWYDFYEGQSLQGQGENVTLDAPLYKVNLLVRAGTIIPRQEPALTTKLSRMNDFSLLVALATDGTAVGSLYWDDGDTNEFESGRYLFVDFDVEKTFLASIIRHGNFTDLPNLSHVTFWGFDSDPRDLRLKNISQHYQYDGQRKILSVDLSPNVILYQPFVLTWT